MERMRSAVGEEPTPRRAELWRLAERTRDVIEALVATTAPEEALTAAAAHVEAALRELEGYSKPREYEGFAETPLAGGSGDWPGQGESSTYFFDHSPVIGVANPLAPPVKLEISDGMVRGHARFGTAYEGPPGSVHGGYVACAFDEVLGMTQSLSGRPGMTGTLTVRYRRPTPLHADLRFEGTLDGEEGRKLFTSGRLYYGDELCAEAEGIFITVDFSKIIDMMVKRDDGTAK